mmetsp:Transcript_15328/g.43859  ORF Transcript_15328/g.43859 Transcript_15328/m.43859 type:complete len:217 (-) Transcript_15328:737-1387(-)
MIGLLRLGFQRIEARAQWCSAGGAGDAVGAGGTCGARGVCGVRSQGPSGLAVGRSRHLRRHPLQLCADVCLHGAELGLDLRAQLTDEGSHALRQTVLDLRGQVRARRGAATAAALPGLRLRDPPAQARGGRAAHLVHEAPELLHAAAPLLALLRELPRQRAEAPPQLRGGLCQLRRGARGGGSGGLGDALFHAFGNLLCISFYRVQALPEDRMGAV